MSCLFSSDDQNTWASVSTSVLPVNIQSWSPLWLTGLISLLSKGLSGVFSSTAVESINYLAFYLSKTIALTIQIFVGRVMFLLFNTQPSLAWSKNASICSVSGPTSCPEGHMKLFAFIRNVRAMKITEWNRCLLLKIKFATVSTFFPSICNDETRCRDLSFLNAEF